MRLNRLVQDLYDLSIADLEDLSYYKEQVNVNELIRTEVEGKKYDAEKAGLSIMVQAPDEPVTITGDSQRLQQLIANLLSNSITYSDPGGTIKVSIALRDENVHLDISDTTPGVPDHALPHLFDRLFRVEQSRNRALGGAGLGLAICHQIVKAHEGSISAKHSPAGGLLIQISLPLSGVK